MAQMAKPLQLQPRTLQAFDSYTREAEMAVEETLHESELFLWSEAEPELRPQHRGRRAGQK